MNKNFEFLTDTSYLARMGALALGMLSPIIMVLWIGYLPSISSYWSTNAQPLFIMANAITSYYLFSIEGWRASSFMLLLLTAFSIDLFPMSHNIMAVAFFIMNVIPLYKAKRYGYLLIPYIGSLILLPFSMTVAEILAIDVLCIHHGLRLNAALTLKNKRKDEQERNV